MNHPLWTEHTATPIPRNCWLLMRINHHLTNLNPPYPTPTNLNQPYLSPTNLNQPYLSPTNLNHPYLSPTNLNQPTNQPTKSLDSPGSGRGTLTAEQLQGFLEAWIKTAPRTGKGTGACPACFFRKGLAT